MSDVMRRFNSLSGWKEQSTEVRKEELSKFSDEYDTVNLTINGQPSRTMKEVYKIYNPYLYYRYMLRKDEYDKKKISYRVMELFHATDARKVDSILQDNLDWRRVARAKFGIGVSFSPSTAYANKECSRSNGRNRAIIVAKVIVGKKESGDYHQTLPNTGYDTTTGNSNKVYVKYYDDEFYPEYVVYYNEY